MPFITSHTETGAWLASVFLGAAIRAHDQALTIRGTGARALRAGSRDQDDPVPTAISSLKQTATR